MRNNLLSGTVGGLVGTAMNTPYVFHPLIRTMPESVHPHDGRFIHPYADLTLLSHESKVRQEFQESSRNTTGRTQRKCQFLGRVKPLFSLVFINRDTFFRLVTIMREEGPAALYKGFVPKVLRLAPGGGVLLLVVEFTLEVFRKGLSVLFPSCDPSHVHPVALGPPYV